MSFEIEKNNKYTLIRVTSEKLDTGVAPNLKSELVVLNTEGIKHMIIDLGSVRYCDSSGLSSILVGNRLCKNSNGNFAICGLQEPVKKLIAISQLDTVLNIASGLKEAESMLFAGKVSGAGSDAE